MVMFGKKENKSFNVLPTFDSTVSSQNLKFKAKRYLGLDIINTNYARPAHKVVLWKSERHKK